MKKYKHITIRNWSVEDRPREKLINSGIQALSNAEIVALLLGSGTRDQNAVDVARNVLSYVQNDLQALGRLQLDELTRVKGIGNAKAITLLAALELGLRRLNSNSGEKVSIRDSRSAYHALFPNLGVLEHEEFWILLLNRAHKVIQAKKISQGGLTGTVIDTRMILKYALDKRATAIIVAHNHPSGNIKPSDADIQITRKIKSSAKIMDINLLDHLVIAGSEYYSFADEGIL